MTEQEIERDRAEFRRSLTEPAHPWHQGSILLLDALNTGGQDGREFLRKIAPYAFEVNGAPIRRISNENGTTSPSGKNA